MSDVHTSNISKVYSNVLNFDKNFPIAIHGIDFTVVIDMQYHRMCFYFSIPKNDHNGLMSLFPSFAFVVADVFEILPTLIDAEVSIRSLLCFLIRIMLMRL